MRGFYGSIPMGVKIKTRQGVREKGLSSVNGGSRRMLSRIRDQSGIKLTGIVIDYLPVCVDNRKTISETIF